MLLHIVQSGEFFSTNQANILSGVHPAVVSVLPTSLELFPANQTAVRFFTRMVAPVFEEFPGRVELLCTYVADERTLICMLALVYSD